MISNALGGACPVPLCQKNQEHSLTILQFYEHDTYHEAKLF